MTSKTTQQSTDPTSGSNAYAEVNSLCKKRVTAMLTGMISAAGDYRNWSLSADDAARLDKLLKHKQRIICSSFVFQLNRKFTEFKTPANSEDADRDARDWPALQESGEVDKSERESLDSIVERYQDAFKEFDRVLLKRLQACIRRPRASLQDNPLQIKNLLDSFRYSIDGLQLQSADRIALYGLFSERFVEALGPLYRSVDQFLLEQKMMPDLAPATIKLRNPDGLSESQAPESLKVGHSASLLFLLQHYKEKSRLSSSRLTNYFPELKKRFGSYSIHQYDEQIDQLNLIFKLIFEDEDLPAPVKQQLARLQIYVFITAIQEDGFLRRSSNPARRLLDAIVKNEVEIARVGNSEFSGLRFIREHIDGMASLQFITVDHYTQMLDGYRTFILDNEASIRRNRKIEATRKAMPVVRERLSELTQPLRIQGTPLILFEKVWLPLMVQIALQRGMDSEPWHKSIAMVQKQVWSLIPKNDLEEQAELQQVLPQVAHSLHRAMRSLKLAESLQQSLRDFLKLEQQNVIEQTAKNIIDAKRKTRSLSAQSFAAPEEDTTEFDEMMQTGMFQIPTDMLNAFKTNKPEPPKKINQVEALSVGEWVNFRDGADKTLAKLAWKSEESTLFIFVDRDGNRVCEIDATELSAKFESGDVALTSADSANTEKSRFSFMKTL